MPLAQTPLNASHSGPATTQNIANILPSTHTAQTELPWRLKLIVPVRQISNKKTFIQNPKIQNPSEIHPSCGGNAHDRWSWSCCWRFHLPDAASNSIHVGCAIVSTDRWHSCSWFIWQGCEVKSVMKQKSQLDQCSWLGCVTKRKVKMWVCAPQNVGLCAN